MTTTANVCLFDDRQQPFLFHRTKDGDLAIVGADLIRVTEGLWNNALRIANLTGWPPQLVTNHDVLLIFRAWTSTYQAVNETTLADHLYALDLDRECWDIFGHAEASEFQPAVGLEANLQWYMIDQFRAQVNAERAHLNCCLADCQPGFPGFPSI